MKKLASIIIASCFIAIFAVSAFADGTWIQIEDTPFTGDISDFIVDNDGVLWAGVSQQGLFRYDGNTWQKILTTNSLLINTTISGMAIGPDGSLWVGQNNKLFHFDGAAWESIHYPYGSYGARFMDCDDSGTVWLVNARSVSSYDGETWRNYDIESGIPGDNYSIKEFTIGPQRNPYCIITFFTSSQGSNITKFYTHDGVQWREIEGFQPVENSSNNLIVTKSGEVWAETDNTLYRIDDGSWDVVDETRPRNEYERDAYDKNSDLWRFGGGKLFHFVTENSTDPGGQNVITDGTWLEKPVEITGIDGAISDILTGNDGVVYVSVNGTGVYRFDGESRELFNVENGYPSSASYGMALDADGVLWVGAENSLCSFDGAAWQQYMYPDGGFDPVCIDVDRNGVVWCGGGTGGCARFDGENWIQYTSEDGLPGSIIRSHSISSDRYGMVFYAFTHYETIGNKEKDSVYFFDGRLWKQIESPGRFGGDPEKVDRFLTSPSGVIMANSGSNLMQYEKYEQKLYIVVNDLNKNNYCYDSDGTLWAVERTGDSSYSVTRNDGYEWTLYDTKSGQPTDPVRQLVADSDGGLWAATDTGLYRFTDTFIGDEAVNAENVIISEIMASNSTVFADSEGNYFDWIELYNTGDEAANLAGCGLSDREDNPFKWTFPGVEIEPHSYLVVYASGEDKTSGSELHTNFKISTDGESLVLMSPDGIIVDSAPPHELALDISWGRDSDGLWVMFADPTPGENNTVQGYTEIAGPVEFSIPSGCYSGGVTVEITSETSGAVIRYTTDGSVPTENSPVYSGPIFVGETTAIRGSAFVDGLMPGKTVTQTFFIDSPHTIPVVSLTTEHFDDLYEFANQISTAQTSDVYKVLEYPLHIEMYEPGSGTGFSLDAGFGIQGLLALHLPMKSLSIFARNRYGENEIKYRIFPDIARDEFDSIILRTAGNDCLRTLLKDGFMTSLVDDLDLDTMGYRPSVVYVNGGYFGIHNIREKMNEDYLAAHHNVDPDNVDMMEFLYQEAIPNVIEGDAVHYTAMIDFLKNNDIANKDNYEYIQTQMDTNNFIDYNVMRIYMGDWDWPHQNIKWWRPKTENGKWRWLVFDLEAGFDMNNPEEFGGRNYLERVSDFEGGSKADPWSVYLLSRLLENDTFKVDFINRMADYLNTIYLTDTVVEKLSQSVSVIEPEMPLFLERWKNEASSWIEKYDLPVNIDDWHKEIALLEEFAQIRPAIVLQDYINHFNLTGTENITLNTLSEGGTIRLNSLDIDTFPWSGTYFMDVPITLTAQPNLGYRFIGWEGALTSNEASIELTLTNDTELTAVFEKTGNDIVIGIAQSPFEVTSDLVISPEMTLTLDAGVELLMSADASIIVQGKLTVNGTSDNPVTIHSTSSQRWGAIVFDNAEGASTISHAVIRGASHGSDALAFPAAVSGFNSDFTVESVQFEENIQGIFAKGGNVTVKNCVFESSNSNEPVNIVEGWALVEGCRFYEVQAQDAIDFDGVRGGIIRDNAIFGSNDDGIDIGDGCSGILITGNRVSGCFDKAISIGEVSKDIRVERNILTGSGYGVAVKDNSSAVIDHTTFYGNDIAIAGYEKGIDASGGGQATVTNSILAGSESSALMTDDLSAITITYSLADKELLPGEGNLQGDPLFQSPRHGGFMLTADSPAINTGDPGSPRDSNGSRADIGALEYRLVDESIVITEINYNPSPDFDTEDWIEIYNASDNAIDLSGYRFRDESDENVFAIPEGTILDSGSYLVLCRDRVKFSVLFTQVTNMVGDFDFGLNNAGEALRIFDNGGAMVDVVVFDDEAPWPVASDGSGATLALKSPGLDNSAPGNWGYSSGHGTPGAANADDVGVEDVSPLGFSLGQNYPNPFNPVTTIPFTVSKDSHVTLTVYSVLGQKVLTLVDEPLSVGTHVVQFDASELSSGIFFYRIEAGDYRETASMLLVK